MTRLNDAGTIHTRESWKQKLDNAGTPQPLAPRSFRQWVALCCGGIGVLGMLILAALPHATATVRTLKERRAIQQTGQPTFAGRLNWSRWQPPEVDVAHSELTLHRVRADWPIAEYRIGRAQSVFHAFTVYQAKFRRPDARLHTDYASGPQPLVAPRAGIAVVAYTLACAFATLMFGCARRLSRPSGRATVTAPAGGSSPA